MADPSQPAHQSHAAKRLPNLMTPQRQTARELKAH